MLSSWCRTRFSIAAVIASCAFRLYLANRLGTRWSLLLLICVGGLCKIGKKYRSYCELYSCYPHQLSCCPITEGNSSANTPRGSIGSKVSCPPNHHSGSLRSCASSLPNCPIVARKLVLSGGEAFKRVPFGFSAYLRSSRTNRETRIVDSLWDMWY